jgi:hypothetical protein
VRPLLVVAAALPALGLAQTVTGLNRTVVERSGRVSVTGSGFGSFGQSSRVTIGGVDAWVTTWTDTRVVAFVRESTPLGGKPLVVHTSQGSSPPRQVNVKLRAWNGGRVLWRFEADDLYIMTRPVVAPDGTVYAKGILGHTYALAPDGALKWVYNDGLTDKGDMSLMADGTLVIGGASNVIALWPNGTKRWQVSGLGSEFSAGPTVGPDGRVYGIANPFYGGVGGFEISADGQLNRTISLRTNVNGSTYPVRVVFGGSSWYATLPPPAVGGGFGELLAFDLGGGLQWSRTGQGQALRLPNGNVYVQRANNDNNYGAYAAGGGVAWAHSFNSFGVPQFFPNVGPDGSVYQVAGGSRLVKFSQDGAVVSNRNLGYWTLQYPAVKPDDSLVVMNGSYNLTEPREMFGARHDGTVVWRVKLPQERGVFVAPISVMAFSPNGRVAYQGMTWDNYAADTKTYLYAIDTSPTLSGGNVAD